MRKLFMKLLNVFKRKQTVYPLIEFNREKLGKEMVSINDRLHVYKDDDAMKDFVSLLRIGRDITVLDCTVVTSENERIRMQARLEVYNEIRSFVINSVNRKAQDSKEGSKPVKGTFNIFRKVNNQASAAI